MRWHRSGKTPRLDVIIDPREEPQLKATYLSGKPTLHDDLRRILPVAIEKAQETWRRGATERGMLNLVRELRERQSNVFGFEGYSQLPLAHAFLSARCGDLASADKELDRYIARIKLDNEAAAKLKKLALEYADAVRGL